MTTDRQIAANRRNASRSTGPRTSSGKARSRRNALRHGLAVSILSDPATKADVKRIAEAIVGSEADPRKLAYAMIIAETQLDLSRIHAAGILAMESAMTYETPRMSPPEIGPASLPTMIAQLRRLHRYQRRVLPRRRRAMRALEERDDR